MTKTDFLSIKKKSVALQNSCQMSRHILFLAQIFWEIIISKNKTFDANFKKKKTKDCMHVSHQKRKEVIENCIQVFD